MRTKKISPYLPPKLGFQFFSLAWDLIASHFVAGSTLGPAGYAIPEAGTIKYLPLNLGAELLTCFGLIVKY